jgi:hypothetical protein
MYETRRFSIGVVPNTRRVRFPTSHFPLLISYPTSHFLLLISQFSFPTSHFPLLISTSHFPLLISHFSFITSHLSLLIYHFSFTTSHFPLLIYHFSFPNSHFPLLISHFSFTTSHLPFLIYHFSFPMSPLNFDICVSVSHNPHIVSFRHFSFFSWILGSLCFFVPFQCTSSLPQQCSCTAHIDFNRFSSLCLFYVCFFTLFCCPSTTGSYVGQVCMTCALYAPLFRHSVLSAHVFFLYT